MGKPELIDPRALYHGDEFAPQKRGQRYRRK